MKFKKLWLTAIGLSLVGAGVFAAGISAGGLNYLEKTYVTASRKKVTLDKVTDITLDLKNQGIIITESYDDKISLEYYKDNTSKKEAIAYTLKDGKLSITDQGPERKSITVNGLKDLARELSSSFKEREYASIFLSIPRDYKINSLQATSKIGQITLSQIAIKTIDIKTEDGSSNIHNINSNSLKINTNTGVISTGRITAKNVALKTVDGDIFSYNDTFENLTSETSTGYTLLENALFSGNNIIKTSDNDIRLTLNKKQDKDSKITTKKAEESKETIVRDSKTPKVTLKLQTQNGDISVQDFEEVSDY